MKTLRKILRILLKSIAAIVIVATMAIVATSVSPIYDFAEPKPFSGADIFNPYRNLDSTHCWKRANFHVHTRVDGIFNECDYSAAEAYIYHLKLNYNIVTFSNHNELTPHPFYDYLQVNVYEHGYNLFKFHKLVFGSDKVNRFDHLLPLFASQRQFQFDMLAKESDIIQFNHPLRTTGTTKSLMSKLEGYNIIELDCGKSTENEFWDWALSAGHYSFALANDDLHYIDRTSRFARRCNFLCTPTPIYYDIRQCLLDGCYYSMRLPDYGNGDWGEKMRRNHDLPYVKDIGAKGDTIYIALSIKADSIKVFGQNHATLSKTTDCDHATYVMRPDDPYARFTAYLTTGEVIYSNPFARYDAKTADSPIKAPQHKINIPLTILFNAILLALLALLAWLLHKTIRYKKSIR